MCLTQLVSLGCLQQVLDIFDELNLLFELDGIILLQVEHLLLKVFHHECEDPALKPSSLPNDRLTLPGDGPSLDDPECLLRLTDFEAALDQQEAGLREPLGRVGMQQGLRESPKN